MFGVSGSIWVLLLVVVFSCWLCFCWWMYLGGVCIVGL